MLTAEKLKNRDKPQNGKQMNITHKNHYTVIIIVAVHIAMSISTSVS